MKRNIGKLVEKEYDLLIVGGGAFGVCAAWDAVLRGLSVALVEKKDFCHATSANHFKMVHGGIRYLQHADIYRIRESSHERSALLRIAPHLIQPLPIVVPTYGHGTKGKGFLKAGFTLYDFLTLDRNFGIPDPSRQIPNGYFMSRREILKLFPGLEKKNLTGGAVFYDGRYYNPPRAAISFLKSAVDEGAEIANYLEVIEVLKKQNKVFGVKVKDCIDGSEFEIHSKIVLVAAGPWSHRLLANELNLQLNPKPFFSRDLAFVVRRSFTEKYGLAYTIKTGDTDAILDRGGRHIFLVPWRGYTLVGVWHVIFDQPPEQIVVTEQELQGFIDEVNDALPSVKLTLNDVSIINTGLTLFGEESKQGKREMSFGKRSLLIDHSKDHNIEGLVTLIGVRATTARGMAEKAIDLIYRKMGKVMQKSKTATTSIYGGKINNFEDYVNQAIEQKSNGIGNKEMRLLIHNYGSQYREVLQYIDENPKWVNRVGSSTTIEAEIIHAVRNEMAQKLEDVVFRRTDLGTAGDPGREAIQICADLMAKELSWDNNKTYDEVKSVGNALEKLMFLK